MKLPSGDRFDVGGRRGGGVYIGHPPLPNQMLSKGEALVLAAWLVAIIHDEAAWTAAREAVALERRAKR